MRRDLHTLARVPLFETLSAQDIRDLDARCAWHSIPAREWIIDHQDEGIDVYFIVAGAVRILVHSTSGREVILADLQPGSFFGELAAIDGQPRSAGVLALSASVMARMPGAVFVDVVCQHPELCRQVLQLLAARIRALDTRVVEHPTMTVQQRIWAELLRLSRPAQDDRRRRILSPPPVHADLAARVSANRESITRELNRLEREGLLERRRGAFHLSDAPRLMERLGPAT